MNITILKKFKLIFFLKNLINIIIDYTYINYTYKIILMCMLLLILSFIEKFSKILINFE